MNAPTDMLRPRPASRQIARMLAVAFSTLFLIIFALIAAALP
jgi:hypothetical protein